MSQVQDQQMSEKVQKTPLAELLLSEQQCYLKFKFQET